VGGGGGVKVFFFFKKKKKKKKKRKKKKVEKEGDEKNCKKNLVKLLSVSRPPHGDFFFVKK